MKILVSLILFLLGGGIAYGQHYADSLLAYRQQNMDELFNDSASPLKASDKNYIHFFPPDSQYRMLARLEFLHNEMPLSIPTSDGTTKEYMRFAKAIFTLNGQEINLTIYKSVALSFDPKYKDYLFLPFNDQSNGIETYGAGRYIDLSTQDIHGNHIQIDFNKAYNPYCAYSGGYRCPKPPPENTITLSILAGEKQYTGTHKERPVK